ncbi:MAG: insulinase family protein [Chitinispirillaceae bacterium]|nr:insulinase family protein [Chitinispirillaceae bacterium]
MAQKNIPRQDIKTGDVLHGFRTERVEPITELHATAYLFTHAKTGARLLHLCNGDPENLFCIAFRTPVSDDTGVSHILEHSVLCGSKKFPVKDPFQEMLKGSLQTFLNALTYRDKTVYPVASQVEKDFFNLVDVYCDAVFRPLLTENTFYQEGWHFYVSDAAQPPGIKGIVYNEMKGVFSDFAAHVARRTIAGLMPDTSYAFESGGDPEHIPDLSYGEFARFHRAFYHPSNSYIFLYGSIRSGKTLRFLNDHYLAAFTAAPPVSSIAPQPLWRSPRTLAFEAPAPKENDGTATVLLAWIFGESRDPLSVLCGTVLDRYLLGAESSPLRRALVDSGLGEDLDDASGFGVEAAQSVFTAGLRKAKPDNAEKILETVLAALQQQVDKGMDRELLEGALRQAEFRLREVDGGHFPYYLKLADRCFNSWLYGGDPLAHLAFEKPLSTLTARMNPDCSFFRGIIRDRLLGNNHRLLAVISASSEKGRELERQTELQALRLTGFFSPADRERYLALTRELVSRQSTPTSAEALATLPRLSRTDLPPKGFEVPCVTGSAGGVPCYCHRIFTSGIVYCDIGFDLRGVPPELIPFLPLYLELLGRCGAAGLSYERMATRIALATGGIGASSYSRTIAGTRNGSFFHAFMHGKCLLPRVDEMLGIFVDLFADPDLSGSKQIKDILFEARNGLSASVIGSGHHVAMLLASSGLSRSRRIEELTGGVSQLRFLDALCRGGGTDGIIPQLRRLHGIIINRKACVVSVTADDPDALTGRIASFVESIPAAAPRQEEPSVTAAPVIPAGIEIRSAVNFTARAWRLGACAPEEYGLLFLLARHLSTGYLWDKVRVEGGAYGGMAGVSTAHPVFSCTSYRDPNLASTLAHFEKGLGQAALGVSSGALGQSVIGAIGQIDKPKPPHSRGFSETLDRLCGYTPAMRRRLREAVLSATPDKLQKTARKILDTKESAAAVLGSAAAFDKAENEGIHFNREPLLKT